MNPKSVGSGIVAGLVGATVLIVFFFAVDLLRGEPLATPNFLSGALLGQAMPEPGAMRIVLFTVAHYLVFLVLGVLAAIGFEITGIPRNLFVGAFAGLFICSLIFYPALIVTGTDILRAPGWPLVFGGNLLAGMAMVAWLRRAGPEPGLSGVWGQVKSNQVLREGIVTGLWGGVTVAVWFLAVDTLAGHPLFTPAALGSAILFGSSAASEVSVTVGPIVAYSLIHFGAFLLLGLASAALVTQMEKFPPLAFAFVLLFVVYWTFVIFLITMLGTWVLRQLAWWAVFVGNLLGAFAMGIYLWKAHPRLREGLSEEKLWDRA